MSEAPSEPLPAPPQLRDRFTFLLIITATFGLQALTLVTGVIVARVLGVEGRGIVALTFAIGLFASQLTLGSSLPNAIAKNLAERRVRARDGLAHLAPRIALLTVLPCLAAATLMFALGSSASTADRWWLAVAAFVMTLQTIAFRLLSGGLQGEGSLVRMAWAGLIPQFGFAVVLTVVWAAGWSWDALDILAAFFVTSAVGVAYSALSLLPARRRPEDRLDASILWAETRRSYVSSARPLDGLQIDRIVVGAVLGTVALGLYAAAAAVSNLCSLVSNAVAVVVLPRVAGATGDHQAQRAVIRRWTSVSAGLIVVMVVALEVAVGPIIRIAFGTEFEGAITPARWLILADGLMAFRKVLIAVLQGQGRGGRASWIELVLLPVLLVGIAVAASQDSLSAIGACLVVVGGISCVALGASVRTGTRIAA